MRDRVAGQRFALLLIGLGAAFQVNAAEPASGDASLAAKIGSCAACHGIDGNSTTEGIPSIAGQPETFLVNQMILMREGVRRSEVMRPQVRGLDDETIVALARHFSKLTARPAGGSVNPELFERGRALARSGGCGGCHRPDFSGRAQIPRLAGQREDYLAATLIGFRDGDLVRPDTTMTDIMLGATDKEIRALAHFFAHQSTRKRD